MSEDKRMSGKPSYTQLELKVKELEKEAAEHRQARKELEEARDLRERVLDVAGKAIVGLDVNGATTFANPAALNTLGLQPEELLGNSFHDTVHHSKPDGSRFPCDDCQISASLKTDTVLHGNDQIFWRSDGASFPVEYTRTPLKANGKIQGAVITFSDISKLKQAEKDLLEEKNKLEALFAAIADGLTAVDTEYKIIYQNKTHRDRMGEHVGDYCYRAYHQRDIPCEKCALRKCFADGEVHRHEAIVQTDRGAMYLEISASPIKDADGNIVAGIEIVRDMTDKKKLGDQLVQAQKMEAIGTLAGGIAHDFNNMLNAIIGYAELLMFDTPEGSQPYHNLDAIITACNRGASLVNQILTFSRQSQQQKKALHLKHVLKEALQLLRGSLPSTIDIRQHINDNCGAILADPTQMHQIIINLCANAFHAMRKHGGILIVKLEEVDIGPKTAAKRLNMQAGTYAKITVGDTGLGMDEETMAHIFEPYYTNKKAGEGTGLGLATVHGIVSSHNGAIFVDSQLGQGTTCEIFFPVLATKPAVENRGNKPALPRLSARVLFVDDEETIAWLGKNILERLGCEVTTCTNSIKALEQFLADPRGFDIVITDQAMPLLTGTELAKQALYARPDLPVILSTGNRDTVDEKEIESIGIKALLFKPLAAHELASNIAKLVNRKT